MSLADLIADNESAPAEKPRKKQQSRGLAALAADNRGPQIPQTAVANPALVAPPTDALMQPPQPPVESMMKVPEGPPPFSPATIGPETRHMASMPQVPEPPEYIKKYVEPGQAFTGAVLQEASMGLADPVLKKIAPELDRIQEEHPWLTMGGQLAGFIAPYGKVSKVVRSLPGVSRRVFHPAPGLRPYAPGGLWPDPRQPLVSGGKILRKTDVPEGALEALSFGVYDALRERDPKAFLPGFAIGAGFGFAGPPAVRGVVKGAKTVGRGVGKTVRGAAETKGPLRPEPFKKKPTGPTEPAEEFLDEGIRLGVKEKPKAPPPVGIELGKGPTSPRTVGKLPGTDVSPVGEFKVTPKVPPPVPTSAKPVAAKPPVTPSVAKEPKVVSEDAWGTTQEEVIASLRRGEPVPDEVIAKYPGLKRPDEAELLKALKGKPIPEETYKKYYATDYAVKRPDGEILDGLSKQEAEAIAETVNGEVVAPKGASVPPPVTPPAAPTAPAHQPAITRTTFREGMKKAFSLSDEEADAVYSLAEARANAWAKETGQSPEKYYTSRIAGVEKGGQPAQEAFYQTMDEAFKFTDALKAHHHEAAHAYKSTDFSEYIGTIRQFLRGTRTGKPVRPNRKTLISLDLTTVCPKSAKGKPCLYCYVENPRQQAKILEGQGKKPFRPPSKPIERIPYTGQIKDMPDELVGFLNSKGGLRMYSFGDYAPWQKEAVGQILKDAQERGLYIKAITKQKTFVETFADHPNMRINISTDGLPRKLSEAPSVAQADKWRAGRENVKIRYVALTLGDALKAGADPRINILTLNHQQLSGKKLAAAIMRGSPEKTAKYGKEAIEAEVLRWENMKGGSTKFEEVVRKFEEKVCCQSGKCGTCTVCCGFAKETGGVRGAIKRLNQELTGIQRGSVEFGVEDGRAIMRGLESPNVSTAVHEMAHVWRRDIPQDLLKTAEKWAGVKDGVWTRAHEERFARAFERYLREGKAPTPELTKPFAQFKEWLKGIYQRLKGSPINVKMTPEVRQVFDKMLGGGEVKQVRKMLQEKGVPRSEAHKLAKQQVAPRPPPVKPPAAPEGEKVGLSQEGIKQLEARHPEIQKLEPHEKEHFGDWYAEAKKNKYDQDALRIADDVIAKKRGITNAEYVGLDIKLAELEKEQDALRVQIARLVDEGNTVAAREAMAGRTQLLDDMTKLRDAATFGKREVARAMSSFRIGVKKDDFSITTLMQEAKASKGKPLSAAERETLEESSDRIRVLEKELESAREKQVIAEEQTARFEAQKQVERMRKIEGVKRKVATKREALRKEREDIKKQIAAMGYRLNDITGVVGEGSYLVGRLATNYIRDGALTLEEVVRLVRADIPELTARDIYEALNAKNPKLQKKAQAITGRRVKAIQTEARLLREAEVSTNLRTMRAKLADLRTAAQKGIDDAGQLEDVMQQITVLQEQLHNIKGRTAPGATPTSRELEVIREKIALLRKEMRIDETLADLNEQIRTGDFKITEAVKEKPIPESILRKQVELSRARKRARMMILDLGPKKPFTETVNTLRTAKATADMSYMLRQAVVLTPRRPVAAAQAYGKAFKAFFSENSAEAIDVGIRESKNYYLWEKSGVFLPEPGGAAPLKREEVFMSRFLEKIPGIRQIVMASERNMITGLNVLRVSAMESFLKSYPNATAAELKAWANWVNIASGRGNIKFVNKSAQELSYVVFAPRFSASRIQVPKEMFRRGIGPRVRKEIAKDMAAFGGMGMTALSLAHLAGWDVSLDPRSPDFAKIKVGNTRFDLWGGVQQPMRLFLRIALAGTNAISLTDIKNDIDPVETIGWFSRYKAAPFVNITSELLTGRHLIGGKVKPLPVPFTDVELPWQARTFANAFVPLVIDDIFQAYQEEGLGRAAIVGPAVFHGIGANTYGPKGSGKPPTPPSPPKFRAPTPPSPMGGGR